MTTRDLPTSPTTPGPGNELRLWFIGSMLVATCIVVSLARDVKVSFSFELNRTKAVTDESATAAVPPPVPIPPGLFQPSLEEVPTPPAEEPQSPQCTLCRWRHIEAARSSDPALAQARHRISQP